MGQLSWCNRKALRFMNSASPNPTEITHTHTESQHITYAGYCSSETHLVLVIVHGTAELMRQKSFTLREFSVAQSTKTTHTVTHKPCVQG